ncbi:MAG: hypothetical protein ABSG76_09615 [Xanthobacteraceae bacterium]
MRTQQHAQTKTYIRDTTGHRTLHVHKLHSKQSVGRHEACVGDAAGRGTNRCDPACIGRIAQRAAGIVAQPERTHAGGESGGFATAGSAGGPIGIPGISRETVKRADGVSAQRHVRQIGAADRYRAGRAHALDDRCIRWRHGVCQRRHPPGRGQAGQIDIFLHREGNAMQGPDRLAGGDLPVGRDGAGAGLVGHDPDHGVESGICRIDASQMRIDHFYRAQLPTRNPLRQISRRELQISLIKQLLFSRIVSSARFLGARPICHNSLSVAHYR